ncbi:MAG: hypothetical protein HMLKMBBP_01789 [Planctomycetes bacterium]|nr:hypothetical protein [Planctomycetota bacterium]
MAPKTERRREPRAKPTRDLTLRLTGQPAAAEIRDISVNGVCCTTTQAVPVLTQVHLVLMVPTPRGPREIPCGGAVVRSVKETAAPGSHAAEPYETAIYFTDIREADRSVLAAYVAARRDAGATA